MAKNKGYDFYFKFDNTILAFPITPPSLTINVGSNNEVVTLINEGDINILKSPSLVEVEFEARFPMTSYPYSRARHTFQWYFNQFKKLKEDKKSFRFIVSRDSLRGSRSWDTNLLVSLEDFEIKEDASEGDDVIISFTLKQYKNYSARLIKIKTPVTKSEPTTTSTSNKNRDDTKTVDKSESYTVKKGDCLWNISKKFYGKGSEWKKIYDANKSIIESTAKKYGKKSSSNGHWIYPGCKLTIPPK